MGPDTQYLLVLQIGSSTPISAIGTIAPHLLVVLNVSKLEFILQLNRCGATSTIVHMVQDELLECSIYQTYTRPR